ncbi:hypothetical protein [Streptomyces atroolivaceus]|uniref:Uncharacterized protein n=1 Tax=Streptomyces atroolivaceus TaxID=66869 RepID=A0ABV9VKF6_STRAZ|nr:hypothetical protein [Streptomyces atroolivaceus]
MSSRSTVPLSDSRLRRISTTRALSSRKRPRPSIAGRRTSGSGSDE